MVAPISTQTQLSSARDRPGWKQTQGARSTAFLPPMPKQCQPLAAPALSIPAPSTPEDRERDLPGSAFFFPRWAAGRGHSTITTPALAASVWLETAWLPFWQGGSKGVLGRGGVRARAPSSVLLPECACLGNKDCSSSRIGWASRPSALSFAVSLKNKTNRKGKGKKIKAHLAKAKSQILI